ncbi:MAG: mRNA surveillance protein pelota [Candidatus Bathyarchaeota archaeon]|nr:mRNA surveillance protein pelota [Candidatus Bathyarchaeota archaeon]
MRIIEMNLKKGFVKVIPETFDDLWHLYNIIYKDDEVYARTTREIKPDGKYARPRRGQRIPVFLGVKVEKIAWDKLLGRLRVHGTICKAPETVPLGAHHTVKIALNKPLTIVKKKWARHHVERLKRASKTSEKPITIIAIDDEGYAIATTKQYGVDIKLEERIKLPGKLEAEKRSVATKEYFRKALSSLRQVWTATRSPITIIGVGFVKSNFAKFLQNEATDIAKSVVDVKSVNNSGVAGIYEALRSGVLLKTMKHMRIAEETEVIEEVLKRLGKNESNIAYGFDDVKRTAGLGAIETMVLADTMLRKASDEKRLLLEDLMRAVEQKGGKIMVISTEHEAGLKLVALGGIAALLRYSIHEDLYR